MSESRYAINARWTGDGKNNLETEVSPTSLLEALANAARLLTGEGYDTLALRREGWRPPERDRRLAEAAPALFDACREAFEVLSALAEDEPQLRERFEIARQYLEAALDKVEPVEAEA